MGSIKWPEIIAIILVHYLFWPAVIGGAVFLVRACV